MDLTRKEFLRFSVLTVGGATVVSALSNCGGGGYGPTGGGGGGGGANAATDGGGEVDGGGATDGGAGGNCAADGAKNGVISSNHGHSLTVPAHDFATSGSLTYDIQGTATHSHFITLTDAQRADLLAGNSVTVTSTVGASHTHQVQVLCA